MWSLSATGCTSQGLWKYSCPVCSGGVPGISFWLPRSTRFDHTRSRNRRPPRQQAAAAAKPAAASTAPRNTAVAARAVLRLPATTGAAGKGDEGDGSGGGGGEEDATGDCREAQSAPVPDSQPHKLRPDGVCIPVSGFHDHVDEFVASNYFVQHYFFRKATDDFVRQRRAAGTCRTPHP